MNILQPLAFYLALSNQIRNKSYCDSSGFTLYMSAGEEDTPGQEYYHIVPFQISVPQSVASATMQIWRIGTGGDVLVQSSAGIPGGSIEAVGDRNVIVFRGESIFATSPIQYNVGHYVRVIAGGTTYYSEVFQLLGSISSSSFSPSTCSNGAETFLKIAYSSKCDVGPIKGGPTNGFFFYVGADLAKPTYAYDETLEKDGLDNSISIFKRLEKIYELEVLAPEFIADAFGVIPMFDTVVITTESGETFTAQKDSAKTEIAWDTDCLAKCKLKFSINAITKACCA